MTDPDALTMTLTVAATDEPAQGIRRFELRDPEGRDLPAFTAGSHLRVRTPSGLIRKYSLCNAPSERARYIIAVKREAAGRGGSMSLVDGTRVGDSVEAGLPENAFALVAPAPGYLFVAGGIGITPILSMIAALEADGVAAWRLVYLGRTPETTPFLDELGLPDRAGRVRIHFDEGVSDRSFDLWPLFERPSKAHVYCCGPRPLMDAVRDMTGHWNSANIHFESFVDGAAMATPEDRPFVVTLARAGIDVDVPAGVTILEALRAAGRSVRSSCEAGTCGSCRTVLLEGEALHRDLVLAPDEQASAIMVCVSRARTPRLVLDL